MWVSDEKAKGLINQLKLSKAKVSAMLGKGILPDADEIARSLSGNGDIKGMPLLSSELFEIGSITVKPNTECKLNGHVDFAYILICVDGISELLYKLAHSKEDECKICQCRVGRLINDGDVTWQMIEIKQNQCIRVEAKRIHKIRSENGAEFIYVVIREE
jgi:hypothetical protein